MNTPSFETVYQQADSETILKGVLDAGGFGGSPMNTPSRSLETVPARQTSTLLEVEAARKHGQKYRRALSSVGLERLPYKQEVTGSNPVAPMEKSRRSLV